MVVVGVIVVAIVAFVAVVSSPPNKDELVDVVFSGATVVTIDAVLPEEEEEVASAEKTLAAAKPMQYMDMIMTGSMLLPHV